MGTGDGAITQTIELVDLARLRFDPQNPRLPREVDRSSETDVLDWMLRFGRLPELMASIAEQGFFAAEPLLVVPAPHDSFWVVEGNRRLAAAKLLQNPGLAKSRQSVVREIVKTAKHRPPALPALVYEERSEIIEYLGFRHITGVHQWDSLSKARYLEQMQVELVSQGVPSEELHRRLAKLIGSRADYVLRLLTGLQVYEKIANETLIDSDVQVEEDDIAFSVLTTALNYSNISEFLGMGEEKSVDTIDPGKLKELTRWVFEKGPENRTRLGESRNLSLLSDVLSSPVALREFRDGKPLKDAFLYVEGSSSVLRKALLSARSDLGAAHSAFPTSIDLGDGDLRLAKEVSVSASRLTKGIETALEERDTGEDERKGD